jgi:hypothetical protein
MSLSCASSHFGCCEVRFGFGDLKTGLLHRQTARTNPGVLQWGMCSSVLVAQLSGLKRVPFARHRAGLAQKVGAPPGGAQISWSPQGPMSPV